MDNIKEIKKTIATYVEGVKEFNFIKAESAWFEDGIKISYNTEDDNLEMLKMLDSRPSEEIKDLDIHQEANIELIDVTNTAAIVILHWIQVFQGKHKYYIDYLSLLKDKNRWKIATKVSAIKEIDA
ncbi:MAG: nuclear transport factor 2 family protein [Candidatus Heimdallarchaeaceae archaeon]